MKLMLLLCLVFVCAIVFAWFWITQPEWSATASDHSALFDAARLEQHVRKLSTDFSPRDESHPENLDRVAAYIREEFQRAGGVVSDQPYTVNNKIYRNVVATFGPDVNECVIVGAHYDTAGPLPGADDNASGIAGLVELATLLRTANLKSRVELVAFTLEEPPYFRSAAMGSAVHASSLRKQGARVKAMLSLEMIGYFSDATGSQHFPTPLFAWLYPNQGNFIAVAGRLREGLLVRRVKAAMRGGSRLPVYSINAPTLVAGIDFSDQLNYWQAGYPAVMITDTAFYRNPNYHSPGDTPEKLDYKRMAMVVEGVYSAVVMLSSE
ncbi:MAG TPA: M28 family peptidase [Pyrinomonadaceae bacterium]